MRFGIENRIHFIKNGCIAAAAIVLFVFYFIYRYVFADYIPQFVGLPMLLGFITLGVVFAYIFGILERKKAESTYYELTDSHLLYRNGRLTKKYKWADFDKVEKAEHFSRSRVPVVFYVKGAPLELNHFLDSPAGLSLQIIRRIPQNVSYDGDLIGILEAME